MENGVSGSSRRKEVLISPGFGHSAIIQRLLTSAVTFSKKALIGNWFLRVPLYCALRA